MNPTTKEDNAATKMANKFAKKTETADETKPAKAAKGKAEKAPAAKVTKGKAAEKGKDSTKNLQARIGRSARLGPRSIGVLDAGATSCCLILQSIGKSLTRQLSAS